MVIMIVNLLIAISVAGQIKIAVIDTGIDLKDPRFSDVLCKSGHKDFTGKGLLDARGHGTFVAGLIKEYAGYSGYCMLIYKYFDFNTSDKDSMLWEILAIREAIKNGASIINISGGGNELYEPEYLEIYNHPNVLFVVAAGNNHEDASLFYPAAYKLKNVLVVGALKKNSEEHLYISNFGSRVDAWEVGEDVLSTLPHGTVGHMTGTSMSCGIHTGKIVRNLIGERK